MVSGLFVYILIYMQAEKFSTIHNQGENKWPKAKMAIWPKVWENLTRLTSKSPGKPFQKDCCNSKPGTVCVIK